MKKLGLYGLIGVFALAPGLSFAGALEVNQVLQHVSQQPEAAQQLLTLLSERNLEGEHCDLKFFADRDMEVLCNTDENSVIAFIDFYSSEKPITIEHRLDQQAPVGIHPIEE